MLSVQPEKEGQFEQASYSLYKQGLGIYAVVESGYCAKTFIVYPAYQLFKLPDRTKDQVNMLQ